MHHKPQKIVHKLVEVKSMVFSKQTGFICSTCSSHFTDTKRGIHHLLHTPFQKIVLAEYKPAFPAC